MCRSIHTLYNLDPATSDDEVRAAAVQYVRKISGFSKPSQANEAAFARAVEAVTDASRRLLDELVTNAPPRASADRLRPVRGNEPNLLAEARQDGRLALVGGEARAILVAVAGLEVE